MDAWINNTCDNNTTGLSLEHRYGGMISLRKIQFPLDVEENMQKSWDFLLFSYLFYWIMTGKIITNKTLCGDVSMIVDYALLLCKTLFSIFKSRDRKKLSDLSLWT